MVASGNQGWLIISIEPEGGKTRFHVAHTSKK